MEATPFNVWVREVVSGPSPRMTLPELGRAAEADESAAYHWAASTSPRLSTYAVLGSRIAPDLSLSLARCVHQAWAIAIEPPPAAAPAAVIATPDSVLARGFDGVRQSTSLLRAVVFSLTDRRIRREELRRITDLAASAHQAIDELVTDAQELCGAAKPARRSKP